MTNEVIIRSIPVSESIKCPQCGKMMQSYAKACGFCSYDFVKDKPAPPSKNALQGCFAIMALVLLGALILLGISSLVSEDRPAQAVSTQ